MGKFKVQRKVFTLVFEKYDGLEVRASAVDTGTALEFIKMADAAKGTDQAAITTLIDSFAKQLRGWNLTDEDDQGNDVDIPATRDGLMSLDFEFVFEIIDSWMEAVMGVSGPLDKPSTSGPSSLVESIPMEMSSESPLL